MCEPPDGSQQRGVQTRDQVSDTTVLITEAQVAFDTAAATGVRRKKRWSIALLRRMFGVRKKSRPKQRSYPPAMMYLERARMAREMERL